MSFVRMALPEMKAGFYCGGGGIFRKTLCHSGHCFIVAYAMNVACRHRAVKNGR
jgi:hypothetical protein